MRKNLKRLRFEHDLTQEEMAEKLNVSRVTYCKIENGKSKGTTTFWLNVEKEFPETNFSEITKREGARV